MLGISLMMHGKVWAGFQNVLALTSGGSKSEGGTYYEDLLDYCIVTT